MELHNVSKIKSHAGSKRNNNQQLSAQRSQNTVKGLCLVNPAAALLQFGGGTQRKKALM